VKTDHLEKTTAVRAILQRVERARVSTGGETVAEIGRGVLVFLGVEKGDGTRQAAAMADKLARLRIFEDGAGKMNLDAAAAGAAFLVVSQFTLAASLDRGRRPSFDRAAPPAVARPLVEAVIAGLAQRGFAVGSGRFGAKMAVELVNDGPVTFVVDVDSST